MIARLGRRPFAWGWLVCALGAIPLAARAKDPSPGELQQLATQLGSADFAAREVAMEVLQKAGPRAIEPLAATLRGPDPEASWRAASALAQIAIDGDDSAFAGVIEGLRSSNAYQGAGISLEDLRSKRSARQRRAAETSIRSHGGLLSDFTQQPLELLRETPLGTTPVTAALDEALKNLAAAPPVAPPLAEPPPAPAPPPEITPEELARLTQAEPKPIEPAAGVFIADAYVSPELQTKDVTAEDVTAEDVTAEIERALTLSATWRGGDEGLAELRHLPEIVSVRLEQAPVSDAALKYISVLPRLRDMRIIRSPFTPQALGRFRQRHPNVTVFVNEQLPR